MAKKETEQQYSTEPSSKNQDENLVNAELEGTPLNEGEKSSAPTETEKTEEVEIIEKFKALEKEKDEKYLRLYAEYENFRKRTQKEKGDLLKYAGEEIIKSILPVVDDMERAIAHHKDGDNHKQMKEGLVLIYQKLISILSSKGIEQLNPKGETFDPELHDAITNVPAENKDMKGKVADVTEKGYMLNGKVIRHAKVVVAN